MKEPIMGEDLTLEQLDLMNQQRIIEYGQNTKDFVKNEQRSLFFFHRNKVAVLAFGMLKPVTLFVDEESIDTQSTNILGIGNIIAVEKGQGNGRALMQKIQAYLAAENRIGLGFCYPHLCGFYERCGFSISHSLTSKLRYKYAKQSQQKEELEPKIAALYTPSGSRLIQKIQQRSEHTFINVPFW